MPLRVALVSQGRTTTLTLKEDKRHGPFYLASRRFPGKRNLAFLPPQAEKSDRARFGVKPPELTAAILTAAAARGVDLILMGTRGMGTCKGILFGSVSTRVAQHASCPVMVVR